MKVIDLWTYRIQSDTGSSNAFYLGLEAAKEGFIHDYDIDQEDHIALTKEALPFDMEDELSEFGTEDQPVSCNISSDILDDEDYDSTTLAELIDEVFYDDDTEITLPAYGVVLKITNQNAY